MGHVSRKGRVVFGITAVILCVAAALVYAAWTSSGSGSSYAKATTAEELSTVDVSAATKGDLYPGATGDALIKVDNPNPYPVKVTAVTGSGAITSDSPPCGDASHPTGVSFENQTGLAIEVAAESQEEETLAGAVKMSNASDNSCQGAVFTIPVSLTGASNAP